MHREFSMEPEPSGSPKRTPSRFHKLSVGTRSNVVAEDKRRGKCRNLKITLVIISLAYWDMALLIRASSRYRGREQAPNLGPWDILGNVLYG